MIQGKDFVFVGLQSWDIAIGSNSKNLAREIAKYNRVLYVSKPLDRISLLRHYTDKKTKKRLAVLHGKQPRLEKIGDNLWNLYPKTILESANWLNNRPVYRIFNTINNRRLALQIRTAIRELGFRDVIVFNDNDFMSYHALKGYISPALSVYYLRDYLTSQDYFKKRAYLEAQQIRQADVVVTNSEYLQQYAACYNKNAYFIGQGCDIESFSEVNPTLPPDLEPLKDGSPVIGYAGYLSTSRLDIALIAYLAEQLPGFHFVLVGPEDAAFKASSLHGRRNIHFPGAKPPEEVPDYLYHFDVCINPQLVNLMTTGNYPRKMDEYLAMGKPVVATQTLAMEYFREYVYLCQTPEEYLSTIRTALAEDTPALQIKRKEFALGHTWTANVQRLYEVISQHKSVIFSERQL